MEGGAEVASFFDGETGFYDAAFDARTPGGHALRARLDATLRLLGAEPGRVLDAGMGPGRLLAELSRRGWDVAGADLSGGMVATARQRLPDASARLLQGRLEALPFEDAGFDAVVATGVLEYVEDLPAAVSELARVLRPGGTAVLSAPNPRSLYGIWRRFVIYPAARAVKRHLRGVRAAPPAGTRIRVERLRELLAGSGLAVEAVEQVGFHAVPSPLDELFPGAALRLCRRLERTRPALGDRLATQLVFRARKRPEHRSVH